MCAKVIRIAEGTGFSGWVRLLVVTLLILACKPPASFAAQGAGQDVLSPGEKEWLKAHQCISLAPGRNVAPIGYLDEEGTYRGIAAEYLSLIASRFDLHFEMVPAGNHRQSAEGANKVEADLFGAASESSRLSECLLFTIPFEEFPSVIVVRNDVRKALTLEELAGSSVAIVSGSAAYDYMASNYPALKLINRTKRSTAGPRIRTASGNRTNHPGGGRREQSPGTVRPSAAGVGDPSHDGRRTETYPSRAEWR